MEEAQSQNDGAEAMAVMQDVMREQDCLLSTKEMS
jgi:hypothetical protein